VNIKHCLIITNVTVAMDSRVYTLELIILVNVYVFIWVCFVHRTLCYLHDEGLHFISTKRYWMSNCVSISLYSIRKECLLLTMKFRKQT